MLKTISCAVVLLAASAWAGAVTTARVQTGQSSCPITQPSCNAFWANGALSAARTSTWAESIGCSTSSDGTTSCYAIGSPLLVSVFCTTNSPQIAAVAQSINSNSFISFRATMFGTCTSLTVENGSKYIP
jgi:hypothetical protein